MLKDIAMDFDTSNDIDELHRSNLNYLIFMNFELSYQFSIYEYNPLTEKFLIVISSEQKAHVSFSDCLSVCLPVVCKLFFSRTTGPISIKLGTKHSWVKGMQVC